MVFKDYDFSMAFWSENGFLEKSNIHILGLKYLKIFKGCGFESVTT